MAQVWIERMAVDVRGEGDPLVMIHGLGGSLNSWTALLPALQRYRVVRIELPGAGHSVKAHDLAPTAPTQGKLSAESHAQAVIRICTALGISRAHFAGHSFGTLITQHVAAADPQRVRSLALFGALAEPHAQMRENMRVRAATARDQGMFDIAEAISNFSLSPSTRESLPVVVSYVRDSIGAQDPEGFARNCLALSEARSAAVESIRCPVLIINGDEDQTTPLSGARQLGARLPDVRVEVLSRCGHWPMMERPTECQRLFRDFLDRVR